MWLIVCVPHCVLKLRSKLLVCSSPLIRHQRVWRHGIRTYIWGMRVPSRQTALSTLIAIKYIRIPYWSFIPPTSRERCVPWSQAITTKRGNNHLFAGEPPQRKQRKKEESKLQKNNEENIKQTFHRRTSYNEQMNKPLLRRFSFHKRYRATFYLSSRATLGHTLTYRIPICRGRARERREKQQVSSILIEARVGLCIGGAWVLCKPPFCYILIVIPSVILLRVEEGACLLPDIDPRFFRQWFHSLTSWPLVDGYVHPKLQWRSRRKPLRLLLIVRVMPLVSFLCLLLHSSAVVPYLWSFWCETKKRHRRTYVCKTGP